MPLGLARRWNIVPLFLAFLVAEGQEVLHLVDVPQLVCEGGEGKVEMNIELTSNLDQPHVLTFFRTAPDAVSVTFKLTNADGQVLADEQTVSLASHSSGRRLEEASAMAPAEERNCEEFFLLDGRDPVQLPDTWREARDSFRQLCEGEGGRAAEACRQAELEVFRGYPGPTEETFLADEQLCMRLLRHAPGIDKEALAKFFSTGALPLSALPRRTKGLAGGGTAAGSHSSRNAGAGTYSYSTSKMSTMYSSGYTSTSYGYSGRASAVPSRAVGTYYVVGWWGPRPMFWGSRRYTHCHDGSGQNCSSSSAVDCESGEPCNWNTVLGDEAVRDDLMQTGFKPVNHKGPFTLTITNITGSSFAASRICPPIGWEPTGPSSSSWTPPDGQDLFAALSHAEELVDEEINHWAWIAPLLIVMCCCCLCCYMNGRSNKQGRNRIFAEVQAQRKSTQGDNSSRVIPKDFALRGMSVNCHYTLQVSDSGSFTGLVTWSGSAFHVEGLLIFFEGDDFGKIFWRESQGSLAREVQGSIRRTQAGFSVQAQMYSAWDGNYDGQILSISLQSTTVDDVQEGEPISSSTEPSAVVLGTALTNYASPDSGKANCVGLTNHAAALPGQVGRTSSDRETDRETE